MYIFYMKDALKMLYSEKIKISIYILFVKNEIVEYYILYLCEIEKIKLIFCACILIHDKAKYNGFKGIIYARQAKI